MYTGYYGFSERPFDLSPDPRFLYVTPTHREALASMIYGLQERKGFVSITGEVGTGKTVLIYTLFRNLSPSVRLVHVTHTDFTFDQLLKTIATQLGFSIIEEDKLLLLHHLNRYLVRQLDFGENAALVIDEAQNLSKEVMEEIRMLSNLETAKVKLLQILLVGQPELEIKLNSDDMRQFKQRIGIRRRIKQLNRAECLEYIEHRLRVVGSSRNEVFTNSASSAICEYTKGTPRLINILCDNAFLIGFSAGQKKIGHEIIREVIADMDGDWEHKLERTAGDGATRPVQAAEAGRKVEQLNRWLAVVRSRQGLQRGRS